MRDTFEHNGNSFVFELMADDTADSPWEREDGHGDVTEWMTRDKKPGELILNKDHSSARYYDFAGACKIARRDGWGVPAYKLVTENGKNGLVKVTGHWFNERRDLLAFSSVWHDDINAAIRDVYAAHRETFASPRAYAAAAAMADFNRLKDWCNDQWSYVGVIVHMVDDDGDKIEDLTASVWGIESDSDDYHEEVAHELADEIAHNLESRLSA